VPPNAAPPVKTTSGSTRPPGITDGATFRVVDRRGRRGTTRVNRPAQPLTWRRIWQPWQRYASPRCHLQVGLGRNARAASLALSQSGTIWRMGTVRKPSAGAGEQMLRELAKEITDPVGEYQSVAAWHRRAFAALNRWMGSNSIWSREFELLGDDLVLPAPSLAESWDVHEFEERFHRATGVLIAAADDLQSIAPEMGDY
jgi:hypothetical protein